MVGDIHRTAKHYHFQHSVAKYKLGKNCQILYIENGTHNDAIDTWNASERNQLFHWLKGLGFDL